MLNIKKLFTKIVMRFASTVSGPETVSFPFTATKSGIGIAVVNPPQNTTSYVFITEDGVAHARMYSTGVAYTLVFPVVKGKVYDIPTKSNYSFVGGVKLYPVMGGGN